MPCHPIPSHAIPCHTKPCRTQLYATPHPPRRTAHTVALGSMIINPARPPTRRLVFFSLLRPFSLITRSFSSGPAPHRTASHRTTPHRTRTPPFSFSRLVAIVVTRSPAHPFVRRGLSPSRLLAFSLSRLLLLVFSTSRLLDFTSTPTPPLDPLRPPRSAAVAGSESSRVKSSLSRIPAAFRLDIPRGPGPENARACFFRVDRPTHNSRIARALHDAHFSLTIESSFATAAAPHGISPFRPFALCRSLCRSPCRPSVFRLASPVSRRHRQRAKRVLVDSSIPHPSIHSAIHFSVQPSKPVVFSRRKSTFGNLPVIPRGCSRPFPLLARGGHLGSHRIRHATRRPSILRTPPRSIIRSTRRARFSNSANTFPWASR